MLPRALLPFLLTLAALGMAPGAAHLLEMPVKLGYAPGLYAAVTSTLYRWFGLAGGGVQILTALTAVFLAWRLRRTPRARLAGVAAGAFVVSLVLWGGLVAPVNAFWEQVPGGDPVAFAAAYVGLRARWEYGHLAAFGAWLAGWFAVLGLVRECPVPGEGGVVQASARFHTSI